MQHPSKNAWAASLALTLPSVALTSAALAAEPADAPRPPNIVVIFTDDMGYGDLASYGHPSVRTPRLDRMAAEGMRFTQFYCAEAICTPSRAALLTGRLPVRSGMTAPPGQVRVIHPDMAGGLPREEWTLAEALDERGYATACVGKWHLGHLPQYLPTENGFDEYFGIPYSNDMTFLPDVAGKPKPEAIRDPRSEYWSAPLMRGTEVIERPAQQETLTRRYTEEATRFIREHKDEPFFLYLAHSMPHVPLFRSEAFEGVSKAGRYGDVIEEIDWSVGRVLDALAEHGLAEETLVLFTSDNGPWLMQGDHAGSAGPLRAGKNSTWEGGMRVPAIAWWPGTIPAGAVSDELASTLDVLPTAVLLTGGTLPNDRVLDGFDLGPLLTGRGPGPRDAVFYYLGDRLTAIRHGRWKLHVANGSGNKVEPHDAPLLFDLEADPGEKSPLPGDAQPEIRSKLRELIDAHLAATPVHPSVLGKRGELQAQRGG